MAEESRVRQTAYKVWIKDILSGKYVVQEGWDPNYIENNDKKISRANILAIVTEKYMNEDKTYSTLNLDDGSSSIQLRTFQDEMFFIDPIQVGDAVLVIGKPREQNNERFITTEIVKKVDPAWLKIRKLELPKTETSEVVPNGVSKTPEPDPSEPAPEPTPDPAPEPEPQPEPIETKTETSIEVVEEEIKEEDSTRTTILETIEKLETEERSTEEEVIQQSKIPEAKQLIDDLLKEGEIFKLDGKLKIT